MRKIAVLTGKRGGFGAMKPMLERMRDSSIIDLQLICTDQHLSNKFGKTISEVKADFEIAAAIDMAQEDSTPRARSQALARFAFHFSETLHRLRPDILLLYGDRGEVLAAAQVATCFNVPIAHLQGGDRTGSVDEQMRHAITKLSHLHFPSTKASYNRIISMGEDPWRTFMVGDSHVEEICKGNYASRQKVMEVLSLDQRLPILIVLQHSETTEPDASYTQMCESLLAIQNIAAQKIVIYPCSDVGYEGTVAAIQQFAKEDYGFRTYKNLEAPIFWGLMAIAKVIIGNSSAGIVEAAYFSLPAINVGRRQLHRECSTNVLHLEHDRVQIGELVNRILKDQDFYRSLCTCEKIYGSGNTSQLVFETLSKISLNVQLLRKVLPY